MDKNLLTYKLHKAPNHQIKELLRQTVYGTKGGMQITHKDTDWKTVNLNAPDFHTIYLGTELCGVAVYDYRKIAIDARLIDSYYIRYFSINPKYQGQGIGNLLTDYAVKHYKQNLTSPTVFYAYIEAKNLKSLGVSKHFDPIQTGYFSPIYFSRFFPHHHPDATYIKEDEAEVVFNNNYSDVNFHHRKKSDNKAKYAQINNSSGSATAKYYEVNWEVTNYPSNNRLMQKILPKTPLIGKLVEGKKLSFIAVDKYAFTSIEALEQLCEHILHKEKKHKLMLYADDKDTRSFKLKNMKLGALNKLQQAPKIDIQTFFHNCDDNIIQSIRDHSKFISAFDIT